MTRRPKINFDRHIRTLLLDVALLKWFVRHDRREDVMLSIALARNEAKHDDELMVLDFLERHCGGSSSEHAP
jgi:hypothetical protein